MTPEEILALLSLIAGMRLQIGQLSSENAQLKQQLAEKPDGD
jgi:hypothetical protein